jgi:uncharacterized protein YndB with AHSA1/START domain
MTDTTFTTTLSEAPTTPDADYAATLSFNAPAAAVFEALTTSSGIAHWWTSWTSISGSGLAGGELTLVGGGDPLVLRVDEAERPSAVRWTPLSSPLPDWVGTTITFDISPNESGGSRLHFRHAGMTLQLECFDLCSNKWGLYLARLVDYVNRGEG